MVSCSDWISRYSPASRPLLMTKVFRLEKIGRCKRHRALSVQALAEGHVIAIPTCTSYVAQPSRLTHRQFKHCGALHKIREAWSPTGNRTSRCFLQLCSLCDMLEKFWTIVQRLVRRPSDWHENLARAYSILGSIQPSRFTASRLPESVKSLVINGAGYVEWGFQRMRLFKKSFVFQLGH